MKKIVFFLVFLLSYLGYANAYQCLTKDSQAYLGMNIGSAGYAGLSDTCDTSYSTPTYTSTPTYIPCTDTYGMYAKDNFDGTCSCQSGYSFQKDTMGGLSCKPKLYSTYVIITEQKDDTMIIYFKNSLGNAIFSKIKSPYCPSVYAYIGKTILLNLLYDNYLNIGDNLYFSDINSSCNISYVENDIPSNSTLKTCSDTYGENSIDNGGGQCSCKKGYKWTKDKKSCTKNVVCKQGQLIRKGMCIDVSSLK